MTDESAGAAIPREPLKVLSIVGAGRSGTTIMASILGEVDGMVSVGELRWLWRRGVLEGRPCGCGQPLAQCPVWSRVFDRVLPRNGGSARETVAAQQEVAARRHQLRVLRSARGTDPGWPALDHVRRSTGNLVHAVADVTGARVIVDSSKRPHDAAVLAAVSGVDHFVLHMVRDPRAVVWSWQRRDKLVRVAEGTQPMQTRSLLSSVVRWTENGLRAAALRHYVPADRWMFLRYEEFAAEPRAVVDRILAFLGEDTRAPFLSEDVVQLSTNHTVAGNPNRFRVGPVRIANDDEWRRRMPVLRRVAVRILTWPLLLRYGYTATRRVRRRRPPPDTVTAERAHHPRDVQSA
jgi:hypothetical protein